MEKRYVLFAGVNGAGKSTLYDNLIFNRMHSFPRVNSDEILRESQGDWKNTIDQMIAMKEALRRIYNYLENGISFNQETTLSGSSANRLISMAKKRGYKVELYYVGLESADLAVQRVQNRVNKGGHGVEEEVIRKRYENSLKNLGTIIPMCDKVEMYDNTNSFTRVAKIENGTMIIFKECEWLKRYWWNKKENLSKDNAEKKAIISQWMIGKRSVQIKQ